MSRIGTRKRKRAKDSPAWIGSIPIGTCNGSYRGLEMAQEQSRVLANRLLSYSLKAISRVRHQGSSELKALITGYPKGPKGMAWSEWYAEEEFSLPKLYDEAKTIINSMHYVSSVQAQVVAKTVYESCMRWVCGKGGQPRFKGKDKVNSLRSKQPGRYILVESKSVKINGQEYPILWNFENPYHIEIHQRVCEGKYLKACINDYYLRGNKYYVLRVTLDGFPPKKPIAIQDGLLGIDPSLRCLFAVEQEAKKAAIILYEKNKAEMELRRVRQQYSRRCRLSNPAYFTGSKMRGKKPKWKTTRGMLKSQLAVKEAFRVAKAQREQSISKNLKFLCQLGNVWKVEEHGFKGMKGLFSHTIQAFAPSKNLKELLHRAENAGVTIIKVPAREAKLSQSCVMTTATVKKPLNQRIHKLSNGDIQQRDLWAAWLATLWTGVTLDRVLGKALYSTVGPRLEAVWRELYLKAIKAGNPRVVALLSPIGVESYASSSFETVQASIFP